MQKNLHTEIIINAPAASVWAVLTDFAAYPEWNSFITAISGSLAEGGRLNVCIQPQGGRAMRFKPRILACRAPHEMRWLGSLPLRGLFDGEHYFLLEALSEQQTRLIHGERFSGLLVGLVEASLDKHTLPAFEQMNRELKQRAEQQFQTA